MLRSNYESYAEFSERLAVNEKIGNGVHGTSRGLF
jgi:hypothetical protein